MNYLSIILLLAFIVSCFGNETKLINDLKKKYRHLSLKYHPDKQNYSKEISTILFTEVSNIYEMFMVVIQENIVGGNTNNLEIYNSLEKKYKALDKQYDILIGEYNILVEENIDLQNKIKQQNKEYNIIINKYNKLVDKYNRERR
jgi:hypothetical protein